MNSGLIQYGGFPLAKILHKFPPPGRKRVGGLVRPQRAERQQYEYEKAKSPHIRNLLQRYINSEYIRTNDITDVETFPDISG